MSDDYLWDGSGPPDPDVERLEQMLGRLRSTAAAPERWPRHGPPTGGPHEHSRGPASSRTCTWSPRGSSCRRSPPRPRSSLMVGLTWQQRLRADAIVGSGARSSARRASALGALVGDGRIAVGQTLTTDAGSRAKMEVSDIGQVTVDERHARPPGRDARRPSSARARARHAARRDHRAARPVRRQHAVGDGDRPRLRLLAARRRGRVGHAERGGGLGRVREQRPRIVRAGRRLVAHRSRQRSRHAALRRCRRRRSANAMDDMDNSARSGAPHRAALRFVLDARARAATR